MKNVLIVDDHPTNRRVLQAEGYGTVKEQDGIEALSALEGEPPDTAVCDVLMPNMNGYRPCSRSEVRRRPELKDLFFIRYAATDFTPNDAKFGLQLGAERFIRNQGSPSVILRTIEEVVRDGIRRHGKHPDHMGDCPPQGKLVERRGGVI